MEIEHKYEFINKIQKKLVQEGIGYVFIVHQRKKDLLQSKND